MASIRKLLPTIIVLQISLAMGVIGGLSFIAAKKQINQLIANLSWQVTEHIHNEVMAYLQPAKMLQKINKVSIDNGNLDVDNINNFKRLFWQQINQKKQTISIDLEPPLGEIKLNADREEENKMPNSIQYIMFGNEKGEFIGIEEQIEDEKIVFQIKPQLNPERITYELDNQGEIIGEVSRRSYDPRIRPWYKAAKQAGKLTWSEIYTSSYDKTSLRINPVMPIYDNNQALLGVLGIEMTLRQISDFLSRLNISPAGKAFIIENSGELVATSVNEILSISTPDGNQRLSASDSTDPAIEATMEKLFADSNMMQDMIGKKQFKLKIDGQTQFIQIKPIEDPDLDWLILVVIPESDFMDDIYANLRVTMLLSLALLCVAIVVGILTSRWIVKPVGLLNQAAHEIESDNFNPETLAQVSGREDELGQLARVFQEMANRIYARKQGFKKQMEQLRSEKDKKKKASLLINISQVSYLKNLLTKSKKVRNKTEDYQHLKLPELLKKVNFLKGFSDSDIQELIKFGYKTILSKAEYICREDEPGDAFYIILAGSVEIYVEKINKFLTNLSSGAFFGELSLLLGIPQTATVRTKEDTILFVVDRDGLRKLLETYEELSDQIAAELHNHKAELEERKEMLKQWGLLDENDHSFSENPLSWIRQRMTARFGV